MSDYKEKMKTAIGQKAQDRFEREVKKVSRRVNRRKRFDTCYTFLRVVTMIATITGIFWLISTHDIHLEIYPKWISDPVNESDLPPTSAKESSNRSATSTSTTPAGSSTED